VQFARDLRFFRSDVTVPIISCVKFYDCDKSPDGFVWDLTGCLLNMDKLQKE